ncbi:uncharacterized protein LOC113767040 [Coffea eugenioides]|uniref:Uncharacterized protein LOC113736196 n=1 Tax=Coffea arabica TaxID=13443 RepID=A0A6P6WTZ7_COFAR|nr:uncharacterized protein LOC113736196 [Coffea arabica]XP_027118850.1 uncharacterized protein LOC113736198 [Coffea arabica]XP_027118968.1 uncharacterized protein LOC113736275 [Coffea arabica]XP_027165132.1 uncharacterized protein LOC113765228 [Coffea eugenioides]XP_027167012.1 uncharacterized protein LOC113767040 [Coffea eugenioides]
MAAAKSGIGSGQKDEPIIPMASTVNPNDDVVIQKAKFAVDSYNGQAGTGLKFNSVEFGFCWSVSDVTDYLLAINTHDDKGPYCDPALVSDTLKSNAHTYELIWYNHKKK